MRYSPERRAIGDAAEKAFADHKDVELIRFATEFEDKYLRFDMLVDIGFGEIPTDVKSYNPKRKYPNDAYLEVVNAYGFSGWSVPNAVRDRYVTWERPNDWLTVHIDNVYEIVSSGEFEDKSYAYESVLQKVPFSLLEEVSSNKIMKEEQI
jgi:hypothetical protein